MENRESAFQKSTKLHSNMELKNGFPGTTGADTEIFSGILFDFFPQGAIIHIEF